MGTDRSELLDLKNLGTATVNILQAVGIHSREELAQAGSVETYKRIKARNIQASKMMLYALEGALLDIHWTQLKPTLKQQLVDRAAQPQRNQANKGSLTAA